jgi:cell division septum initiation protein DivIVA
MAQEQKKLNPIEDAISAFLKQQKDYEDYLKKLREDVERGTPREKLKGGGKVVSIGSLMDR